MNYKAIVFSLMFLLTAMSVAGAELTPQNVCACGLTVDTFRVVNDGKSSESYTIELAGDAAPYTIVYPSTFTIPPDGELDVTANIRFPCQSDKAYVLALKISDRHERSRTITKAYFARTCPPIQVLATDAGQVGGPCETKAFRFDITNTGRSSDVFTFDVPTHSAWVELSVNSVKINPGMTQTLFATVNAPCDRTGLQNFTLITENSDLRATTPFVLDVISSYDFDVDFPSTLRLCEGVPTNLTLDITNRNAFDNSYSIGVSGSDWVPSDSEVTVSAGDDGSADLSFVAPDGSEGDYNLTLAIGSKYGGDIIEKNVSVSVSECYDYNLTVEVPTGKVCCDRASIPVILVARGSQDVNVDLTLEGGSIFSLADNSLVLDRGTSAKTSILIDSQSCPAEGVHQFTLTSSIEGIESYEKSFDAEIEFVGVGSCSMLTAGRTDFVVDYSHASIDVPVTNDGAKDTYYTFSLEGGSWQYLETFDATLAPGETTDVRIYIDPRDIPEDTYAITLHAKSSSGETFDFPLMLTLHRKVTFRDTMWGTYLYMIDEPCSFTYRTLAILFLIDIALLIIFSIWKNSSKKIRRRSTLKSIVRVLWYIILVIVLAWAAAFLFCNYGLEPLTTYVPENISPIGVSNETIVSNESVVSNGTIVPNETIVVNETEPANESEETQPETEPDTGFEIVIPKSSEFTVNLSEIFSDPDADVLYYTIVGPPKLDIDVDNQKAIATFYPGDDFKEGSTIVVTVSDGEYTLSSPAIKLVYGDSEQVSDVVASEDKDGKSDTIPGLYVYIVLVLLVIVLFIRVVFDQKQEEKAPKNGSKAKKKLGLSDMKGAPKKKRGRPKKKK